MRIAYLTTDVVNRNLALELAQWRGITLYPQEPREAAPCGSFDAVLYDWDFWPAERKEDVLTELLSGPVAPPVALHRYQVDPEQAEALRRHGVLVWRILETCLFASLRQAIRAARVAAAHRLEPHAYAETDLSDRAA
jgi:hypothetical protein